MKKLCIKINSLNDLNNFIQKAQKVEGDVLLEKNNHTINAKSILEVFSLDTSQYCTIIFPEDAVDFEKFLYQFTK